MPSASVTEYLERARECAALADAMKDDDEKTKMLAVADAWLKFADDAAKIALNIGNELLKPVSK